MTRADAPAPGCGRRGERGRSGFLPDRTVHLHPLARCNLACRHCYSASSPQASAMLGMDRLAPALERLRAEGYEVVSLSGGEPLLYPELAALLDHAKALGFRVAAVTNGYRVGPRFARLIERIDAVAVSFDGLAPVHDRVRGAEGAFARGMAALDWLRAAGRPSAAAYTVSRESFSDIPEFVELAAEKGVRAVQLRPLVMAGRAVADYAGPALDEADRSRLWLLAQALDEAWEGAPTIHADLAHAQAVAADRGAWDSALAEGMRPLSDIVNPLVITPDGALRPFTFDFPSAYDLGRIEDLAAPVRAVPLAVARIRRLIRAALDEAGRRDEFIDWFAWLRDLGRAPVSGLKSGASLSN